VSLADTETPNARAIKEKEDLSLEKEERSKTHTKGTQCRAIGTFAAELVLN